MKTIYSSMAIVKIITLVYCLLSCGQQDSLVEPSNSTDSQFDYDYLALGDSYTVGESVSSAKNFPAQITKTLEEDKDAKIKLDIIANTGWRTDDLLKVVEAQPRDITYDFVTLLIGVNNQYQGRPFAQYQNEFPTLLDKALGFANHDPSQVIVVSIPDYGYTPFARNSDREKITSEIEAYNAFAKKKSQSAGVRFVNITDITQRGLNEPDLVADDGLHPSGKAYEMFAARIVPFISTRLKD